MLRKGQFVSAAVLALWLACASPVTPGAQEMSQSNWTSAEIPCARYDDLRNVVLGKVGVRIDTTEPWAYEFRRALGFWNTVLAANFYEETNLNACTVRIINGSSELLRDAVIARAQLTDRSSFHGMIAVNPVAGKAMTRAEIYGVAVHEFGHMLGLKHNSNSQSIMYYFNVQGTERLDSKDILDLSTHHQLRTAIVSKALLPITVVRP